MVSDLDRVFSKNAQGMKKSVIRELLKLTRRPEVISFAGGLPDLSAFPVEEVADVTLDVLRRDGATALQYSPTEGDPRLKEELIAHHEREDGITLSPENVLITVASQQGLDLVAKIFIDRGDPVVVGLPTYVGGLGAFRAYGARMYGVPLDEQGMKMDSLERKLDKLKKEGKKPKFIYVVPDFQNPAGITMSEERRKKLIELARCHDVFVLEDSPYKELRYEGEAVKSIFSLDGDGQVIGLHTFSKILFPGMRLGWVIGPEAVIQKLTIAKQSTDLCTPAFTQAIVAEFAARGLLQKNIDSVKEIYREKRQVMLDALDEHMPKLKGLRWTKPQGGLFLWVTLPRYMDSEELFFEAVEHNVAFVIGTAFYCDDGGRSTMRLNFSFPTKEDIVEGVKRLAKVIEEHDKEKKTSGDVVVTP
ncbi:MAG: aminotransferase class I/II-fold pyridoxal phosphate-dependent enzyme [Candidatus Eisenbacteria bacterium]|nr:aminotransferase class I/II-fold pyridoxal phosphate-dependent enzyme [Candidatus Eisenbacteria bacterium]